jgi:hypothetical protein
VCEDGDCARAETEVHVTPGRTTPYTDEVAPVTHQIIELLRRPELALIDFVCGPTTVSPAEFRARACELAAGRLVVVPRDVPPTGDACYQMTQRAASGDRAELAADTLYVKHGIDLSLTRNRALVLHEMVHATQDAGAYALNVGEAEAAAYTAQALVFRAFGVDWADDLTDARARADALHPPDAAAASRRSSYDVLVSAAVRVASALVTAGRGAAVPPDAQQSLYDAILGMATYHDHVSEGHRGDGISPPTTSITPRSFRRPRAGRSP